jgi:hypothetical protein
VPRKQVGHMAAPTSVAEALKKPLPMGGRPHRVVSDPTFLKPGTSP